LNLLSASKTISILQNLLKINFKFNRKEERTSLRLKSLDTFRGINIFLMIFINYGSGGYKQLSHTPWHGINLSDFIFPWFIWIMGFSIGITSSSSPSNHKSKLLLIVFRTIKMFFIGFVLNSFHKNTNDLYDIRVLGVLQRLSICYCFVSILEQFHKSSLTILVINTLITTISLMITYWLPVPHCPTGYIGPGGLDQFNSFTNCTGGAANYIDTLFFTRDQLYNRVNNLNQIFQNSVQLDPENLLGTLNSIVTCYIGTQASRILTISNKSEPFKYVIYWTFWSLFYLLSFYAINGPNLVDGLIPVNKKLWTLTFTLITGASALLVMAILYIIVDVLEIWSGRPFIYLGKNSILIFVVHSIFKRTFPCQFKVSNTHSSQLIMNMWGSWFWTLVAIYLYYKNIFLTI
jgi:heparan-alpha-glucosaminide N-acetyltransferase